MTAHSDAKIDELLQKARSGDETAFASLLQGLRDRIYRWALVITGDADDAEDVTQQVSMIMHRKLSSFEQRARFTTWLYPVVRNAAIEMMRKSNRTVRSDEEALSPVTDNVEHQLARLDSQRAAALVRSFFTELPPRQRQLLELIDNEGYTTNEAAEMMGIEPETARVHLLRARRLIRARMLELHPLVLS